MSVEVDQDGDLFVDKVLDKIKGSTFTGEHSAPTNVDFVGNKPSDRFTNSNLFYRSHRGVH